MHGKYPTLYCVTFLIRGLLITVSVKKRKKLSPEIPVVITLI